MKIGSLFSGAGGLDMAVEQIFGGHTIWQVENDAAASKALRKRWPCVPNYGDITTINWRQVHPVDVLCAGWPCQPFSLAGKRNGAADERALWPYVAGAVRLLRPRIVVLENVSAVLTAGEFQRVADDLAQTGYEFGWVCVRASDVGAPHRRERVFILAHTDESGPQRAESAGRRELSDRGAAADADSGAGPVNLLPTPRGRDHKGATLSRAGDGYDLPSALLTPLLLTETTGQLLTAQGKADDTGKPPSSDWPVLDLLPTPNAADGARGQDFARAGRDGSGGDDLVTLAVKADRDNQWGRYGPAIQRWEHHTRPAPAPTEPNTRGNPRLNPAFSEWMMGWPTGWVTDLPITRDGQLRIIGNGVVPQQAATALQYLLAVTTPATVGA